MLTSTFVHLKGIGQSTECRLWQDGIRDWATFLNRSLVRGISVARKDLYDRDVEAAALALERGESRYFARCLKPKDHWRLFETFRSRVLYVDIETTGTSVYDGHVTIVGLYRNGRMSTLVHGESLSAERLQDELDQADVLVTFFGSVFDVPYLKAAFPAIRFDLPHFDVCFAARRLGQQGGLKRIEREYEIVRDSEIRSLDGWDAVKLWHRWRAGDSTALDLLIRYNCADTQNLEVLAESLYRQLIARYGPPFLSVDRPTPV
ncbi:MAG TPA: ribonuclease H-like domain-containing protein [Nitrospiraceae bacterium]|nr:ribonuclease H-like domain-containing protein [Nitrospiraceae bacterium]